MMVVSLLVVKDGDGRGATCRSREREGGREGCPHSAVPSHHTKGGGSDSVEKKIWHTVNSSFLAACTTPCGWMGGCVVVGGA